MAPNSTNNRRTVSSSSAYDVIVVGAGLQGCATALNLVRRKQRVLLLDKKPTGRGASGVNSGDLHAFGFSAHGFQLGPIVGKIMADLVTEGRTEFPIEAFRADRFTSE